MNIFSRSFSYFLAVVHIYVLWSSASAHCLPYLSLINKHYPNRERCFMRHVWVPAGTQIRSFSPHPENRYMEENPGSDPYLALLRVFLKVCWLNTTKYLLRRHTVLLIVHSFITFLEARSKFPQSFRSVYTVKKGKRHSRSQPWCHLRNSPWAGIIKLSLPRENLISDIPAVDGNVVNLFLTGPPLECRAELRTRASCTAGRRRPLSEVPYSASYAAP